MKTTSSNFGKWGWGLIVYCFLTYFICSFGNNTAQVVCGMWEEMYGWDQTKVLALPTLGGYLSVLVVYIISVLFSKKKLKLRSILIVNGILYSVALGLWGVVSDFTVFAILLISMYSTYVLWMQFANNTLTSNWFPRKKGIVIGWTTIGLVVGSGFGTPMFYGLLSAFGMTMSYFIMGGFGLLLTLIGYFVFSEYPEQRGCFPDNDKTMTTEQALAELEAGQAALADSVWTPKAMLTIKESWLIGLSSGILILFSSGAMSQMIPRLLADGYTMAEAMVIMTVGAIFGCPGSYLCGVLDAKVGPKKAMIVTLVVAAGGALLNIVPNKICIYISIAIIGAALGGAANYLVSMTTEYWGRYQFQKAYGVLLTINQIIGMSGAALHAYMTKWTGFKGAYVTLAIICLLGILMILPVKDGFVERYEEKFSGGKSRA